MRAWWMSHSKEARRWNSKNSIFFIFKAEIFLKIFSNKLYWLMLFLALGNLNPDLKILPMEQTGSGLLIHHYSIERRYWRLGALYRRSPSGTGPQNEPAWGRPNQIWQDGLEGKAVMGEFKATLRTWRDFNLQAIEFFNNTIWKVLFTGKSASPNRTRTFKS